VAISFLRIAVAGGIFFTALPSREPYVPEDPQAFLRDSPSSGAVLGINPAGGSGGLPAAGAGGKITGAAA